MAATGGPGGRSHGSPSTSPEEERQQPESALAKTVGPSAAEAANVYSREVSWGSLSHGVKSLRESLLAPGRPLGAGRGADTAKTLAVLFCVAFLGLLALQGSLAAAL